MTPHYVASLFHNDNKIVAYRNRSCYRILARIEQRRFGFVSLEGNSMPAFVSFSPTETIAAASSNPLREVYVMDNVSQLSNLPISNLATLPRI